MARLEDFIDIFLKGPGVSDTTPCYIGINKDGECRAACVDTPERTKDTAKTVADWIKRGMAVERVTVEEARTRLAAK